MNLDTLSELIALCENLDENDSQMENSLKSYLETHDISNLSSLKLSDPISKHRQPTFLSSQTVDEKLFTIQVKDTHTTHGKNYSYD